MIFNIFNQVCHCHHCENKSLNLKVYVNVCHRHRVRNCRDIIIIIIKLVKFV